MPVNIYKKEKEICTVAKLKNFVYTPVLWEISSERGESLEENPMARHFNQHRHDRRAFGKDDPGKT